MAVRRIAIPRKEAEEIDLDERLRELSKKVEGCLKRQNGNIAGQVRKEGLVASLEDVSQCVTRPGYAIAELVNTHAALAKGIVLDYIHKRYEGNIGRKSLDNGYSRVPDEIIGLSRVLIITMPWIVAYRVLKDLERQSISVTPDKAREVESAVDAVRYIPNMWVTYTYVFIDGAVRRILEQSRDNGYQPKIDREAVLKTAKSMCLEQGIELNELEVLRCILEENRLTYFTNRHNVATREE